MYWDSTVVQDLIIFYCSYAHQKPTVHRPRLLLAGRDGQGQSTYLAPAVLHYLEQLPVHAIDLPSLFAVSAKTPEEACAQVTIAIYIIKLFVEFLFAVHVTTEWI